MTRIVENHFFSFGNFDYKAKLQIEEHYDASYGEDADGNRAIGRMVIDDIKILDIVINKENQDESIEEFPCLITDELKTACLEQFSE